MRKSIIAALVLTVCSLSFYANAEEKIKKIIPASKNFNFNKRWINPKIDGKGFWYCIGPTYSKQYDMEKCGWQLHTKHAAEIIKELKENKSEEESAAYNYQFNLFKNKKIPLRFHGAGPTGWDEKNKVMVYNNLPNKEDRKVLEDYSSFIFGLD